MKRQRRLGCLFLLVALAVAGCGAAKDERSAARPATSTTASPTASASASLKHRLMDGAAAVRTAHVSFRFGPVDPSGRPIDEESLLATDGLGVESLVGGRLASVDLTGHVVPGYQSRLVGAGGTFYVQLPPELTKSPKPWTLVSPNSANELVRGLTGRLQGEATFGAPYFWATMAGKATQVSRAGTDLIGDVHAAHYELQVPATAFPGLNTQSLLPDLSVDLWTDPQDRVVQATLVAYAKGGGAMDLQENFAAFDAPVSITPPDATEVNAG